MKRIHSVNDFVVKFANVNGSGSASANELFAKAVIRMGVPVSPRNIFPSNIQGLPTWYEARVSEHGWLGRRGGFVARPAHRLVEGTCWPRTTTRSSSAAARRAGATWTFPGARRPPTASTSASTGWLRCPSTTSRAVKPRVIVLGGGNTAMDCCRSARRLGSSDVKVIVRSGFEEMKASPWEKEDAMHEGIPIINCHVPKAFVHEAGKLVGMNFEIVEPVYDAKGRRSLKPTGEPEVFFACDEVLIAVGQENAFPWIERDAGIEFDDWGLPKLNAATFQSTRQEVFFGGDAAFGPKNIITAVAQGHEAAVSIDLFLRGEDVAQRPPPMTQLVSQKMGIHEWSYDNAVSNDARFKVPWAKAEAALASIRIEVELGFDAATAFKETQRCLNCDVQTSFTQKLCIECDACVDICPTDCITFTDNGDEAELRTRLKAPSTNLAQALYVSARAEDRPRDGQGRGRLPALRPVRRALPHRRLGHAEVPDPDRRRCRQPPPAQVETTA